MATAKQASDNAEMMRTVHKHEQVVRAIRACHGRRVRAAAWATGDPRHEGAVNVVMGD
ncbi:MAG: hypothetical protein ACLSVD_02890 [Eggerthellaceae bacterium]